jgi:hypothetical protein
MAAEHDIGRGEPPSVKTRAVVLGTAGILAVLVAIAFGLELFFRDRIGMTFVDWHAFPAPGVVADERAQRIAQETTQHKELNGGGGRMPIEAAINVIVARGPHAFDPIGTPQ